MRLKPSTPSEKLSFLYPDNTEFENDNVVGVYSVGSTALLYAKVIYDISSYLIDITNQSCHPSAYAKAKYIAKQFNIPICTV